jgi:hypothetical protein
MNPAKPKILGGGVKALRTPSTYAPVQFYFSENRLLAILFFQVVVT